MDKILGIFTTIFVGVPLTVISMLISWVMNNEGRNNEQSAIDLDMRVYVPSRCRNRRRNNGNALEREEAEGEAETKKREGRKDAEEVINGLQNLRMSLSWHEKEYLDYACECVYKVDVLTKLIEQYEGNNQE